jgi:hypothetical protein
MPNVPPEALPAPSTNDLADLVFRLRYLLDREGMTPRQFAAESDVPYTSKELYQFLSGRMLPPPLFIDLVGRRCGDAEGLRQSYDQLRAATQEAPATGAERTAARAAGLLAGLLGRVLGRDRARSGSWSRLVAVTAGVGVGLAAVAASAILLVSGGGQEPTAVVRPLSGASSAPAARPAPVPDGVADVPSSRRETSAKQRPEPTKPAPPPAQPARPSPTATPDPADSDPIVRCFRQRDRQFCTTRSGRVVIIRDGERTDIDR